MIDDEVKRPFTFWLEAKIARDFIKICQRKGVLVRDILRSIILEFIEKNHVKGVDDGTNERQRDK
jgi:hypothetical protein